jgi:acid stress-induced BolA-like protein IbaG/YrbA
VLGLEIQQGCKVQQEQTVFKALQALMVYKELQALMVYKAQPG